MNITSGIFYLKKARREIASLNNRVGRKGLSALFSYADFLWCYVRYGCLISQYVNGNFWKYRHTDRKQILTYRGVLEFINRCNASEHIHKLDNKITFNRFFKDYVNRSWLSSEEMTIDDFRAICLKSPQLIVKPLDECEGRGIELITPPLSDLASKEFIKLYDSLKNRKVIIEERIFNHPEMEFNNNSINTVRVNTLLDKSGKVHCFKPVLRVGVGKSVVDNYNAGGCEYSIDPESGIITSLCYQGYELRGIHHPGCDKVMPGYQIPMWSELRQTIDKACHMIPGCRFIGWDVAITPTGIQLIEGNHNPGNVSIEFFGETGWYGKLKQYI